MSDIADEKFKEQKLTWWEKTVEYSYVMNHMPNATLAVPLDGNHEVVGDAIFAECDSWIVIEFKRDHDCSSENIKYLDAGESSAKQLRAHYQGAGDTAPHFFVYGVLDKNELKLEAKKYWSGTGISLLNIFDEKISYKKFKEYVLTIIDAKKGEATGGGSGFGSVVGATAGKVVTSTTIAEFARSALKRDLDQEHQEMLKVQLQQELRHARTMSPGGR
jgi:hypothetical protein